MRCKKGDLAVRIKQHTNSAVPMGAVVRCVEYFSGYARMQDRTRKWCDVWLVEYQGKTIDFDGFGWNAPDEHLMPIRDNEGEDETLQWAPVPVKEIA